MDIDIIAERLATAEACLLSLDKRIDEMAEKSMHGGLEDEWHSRILTLEERLATTEVEIAKAEAVEAIAEAEEAKAEAEEARAEADIAILEANPHEVSKEAVEPEAPALEVIEAEEPEKPEKKSSPEPKKSSVSPMMIFGHSQ